MEELGAISFLAPNGVLIIHDADSEHVAELWAEESQVVSSSESSLLVRVCHAIDGPVSIEVGEGEVGSRPGVQLFSGPLATLNGRLRIRDVNDDCRLTVDGRSL